MFSRTENIDGFHLKLSHSEKELFDEFLKTEQPDISNPMRQYFVQAGDSRAESKSTIGSCAQKSRRRLMRGLSMCVISAM